MLYVTNEIILQETLPYISKRIYCKYAKKKLLNFVIQSHFSLVVPLICHSLPVDCQSLIYAPASQLNSHRECAHVHAVQWQKSAKKLVRQLWLWTWHLRHCHHVAALRAFFAHADSTPKRVVRAGWLSGKKVLVTVNGLYFAIPKGKTLTCSKMMFTKPATAIFIFSIQKYLGF